MITSTLPSVPKETFQWTQNPSEGEACVGDLGQQPVPPLWPHTIKFPGTHTKNCTKKDNTINPKKHPGHFKQRKITLYYSFKAQLQQPLGKGKHLKFKGRGEQTDLNVIISQLIPTPQTKTETLLSRQLQVLKCFFLIFRSRKQRIWKESETETETNQKHGHSVMRDWNPGEDGFGTRLRGWTSIGVVPGTEQ